MNVDLWAIQPDVSLDKINLIARAARICHNSDGDDDATLVGKLIKWGHLSILEHARWTTRISGVSMATAFTETWQSSRYGPEISGSNGDIIFTENGRNVFEAYGVSPMETNPPGELTMEGLSTADRVTHGAATFFVSGISRACSHQLVRHRLGSYSQESMRYCDVSENGVVTPESVRDNSLWHAAKEQAFSTYKALVESGVPKEDARMILPIATKTSIVVTMTFASLLHFFELRITKHAQWEIHELAQCMRAILVEKHPEVFGDA
jgi:thymidylate synthase ThyX